MKLKMFIITIFALFPTAVYADVIVNCPNEINKEIICDVSIDTDYEITGLEYEIETSNDYNIIDFIVDNSWEGTFENNRLLLYTDVNKKGNVKIGEIKVILKKKTNIITKYLSVGDNKFEEKIIINNVNNKEQVSNNNITIKVICIICGIIILIITYLIYKRIRRSDKK